ncbi:MAG: hypothetical protein KF861_04095, partial [Planctomycetaceae bacterium]|nr:hypothetical protein [Planctomycetaceae bacterium]
MKFLRMWFGCLVGIMLTASIADGQDVPVSPRELEIGVIEARQRIRQGHLSIAYRGVYGDDNSDLREGTRTFWFDLDQSQQRMDTFSAESGTTDVSCYGCAGDAARHVVYSDRVLPGMGGAALVIQSANVMPQRQRGDPDVRLIGIVPHSLLNLAHVSLEFLAESVERMQDASIEAVTLDGHKCWLVSGENMAPQGTGERTLIKAWFAEELGRSLVRK